MQPELTFVDIKYYLANVADAGSLGTYTSGAWQAVELYNYDSHVVVVLPGELEQGVGLVGLRIKRQGTLLRTVGDLRKLVADSLGVHGAQRRRLKFFDFGRDLLLPVYHIKQLSLYAIEVTPPPTASLFQNPLYSDKRPGS